MKFAIVPQNTNKWEITKNLQINTAHKKQFFRISTSSLIVAIKENHECEPSINIRKE